VVFIVVVALQNRRSLLGTGGFFLELGQRALGEVFFNGRGDLLRVVADAAAKPDAWHKAALGEGDEVAGADGEQGGLLPNGDEFW
jgi:hypothetical protein